jgi:hypothetical protein
MRRRIARLLFVLLAASGISLQGQEVNLSNRPTPLPGLSQGLALADDATSSGSASSDGAPKSVPDADASSGLIQAFRNHFQMHGTLSQGFIYGSGNNYLTMKSNDGSARWSEGAVNLSTAIRDNFHVGIQIHSYIMGQLGRGTAQVDWAFADYRAKDWLGFRGGRLKAPLGLFGEIEDTDTLYNWALLPQSVYEAEYRSYNVPVEGGEIYGSIKPGRSRVTLQLYGGRRSIAGNDGAPLLAWQLYTIAPGGTSGYTYGGDLKWETPIKGLTAGISLDRTRVVAPHAFWLVNPYGVPLHFKIDGTIAREIYSLRYQRGKLDLAAEGKHEPHWIANNDLPVVPGGTPRNAWYVMGSYHVTKKLAAGSYFTRVVGTSFVETFRWPYYDPSQPEFYSMDTVANARYDINHYFYVKVEGHYIDGDLAAFFPATNPKGLQKVTRLAIVRFGFTF